MGGEQRHASPWRRRRSERVGGELLARHVVEEHLRTGGRQPVDEAGRRRTGPASRPDRGRRWRHRARADGLVGPPSRQPASRTTSPTAPTPRWRPVPAGRRVRRPGSGRRNGPATPVRAGVRRAGRGRRAPRPAAVRSSARCRCRRRRPSPCRRSRRRVAPARSARSARSTRSRRRSRRSVSASAPPYGPVTRSSANGASSGRRPRATSRSHSNGRTAGSSVNGIWLTSTLTGTSAPASARRRMPSCARAGPAPPSTTTARRREMSRRRTAAMSAASLVADPSTVTVTGSTRRPGSRRRSRAPGAPPGHRAARPPAGSR